MLFPEQVGCGAGNTIFPVIETYPDAFVYACDFSPRAVELVKVGKFSFIECFWSWTTLMYACIAVVTVTALWIKFQGASRYPPGPKGVPFLGNIWDVPKDHGWFKFKEIGDTLGAFQRS